MSNNGNESWLYAPKGWLKKSVICVALAATLLTSMSVNALSARDRDSNIRNRADKKTTATFSRSTQEKTVSELILINDPLATKLLTFMANPNVISSSGAAGRNVSHEKGQTRFDVADQRRCWRAVARGIAESSTSYIELGLKAIDYAFNHQERGGNFGRSRWFETMGFLEAALRSYVLIAESEYKEEFLPKLKMYIPKMKLAIKWLIETKESREDFKEEWKKAPEYSNVVVATGVTFHLAGKITQDEGLITEGKKYIEIVLSKQWKNGVFPEAAGYDSSYQAVTLWHLMIYLLYSEDNALNGQIREALKKGWEWEKSRITPKGEVLTKGNSRTGPKGELRRGKRKEVSYPEVIMALLYASFIDEDKQMNELARKVFNYALDLHRQRRR